jgi:hypothetical protein
MLGWVPVDSGAVAAVRAGMRPATLSSDRSTNVPDSSALRIMQSLEPADLLWCIGHVPSPPCPHVQTTSSVLMDSSRNAGSATVTAAAWQISHNMASGQSTRRRDVIKNPR